MRTQRWGSSLAIAFVGVGCFAIVAFFVSGPPDRPLRPPAESHGMLCDGFDPWQTVASLEGARIFRLGLRDGNPQLVGHGRPSEVFESNGDSDWANFLDALIPEDVVFVSTGDVEAIPMDAQSSPNFKQIGFLHSTWLLVRSELQAGSSSIYIADAEVPDFGGKSTISADTTLVGTPTSLELVGLCSKNGRADIDFNIDATDVGGADGLISLVVDGDLERRRTN